MSVPNGSPCNWCKKKPKDKLACRDRCDRHKAYAMYIFRLMGLPV